MYIYIGGWGALTNREIVSFRSCMHALLSVRSEWISKGLLPISLSRFGRGISSLFPSLPSPQSSYRALVGVIGIYIYIAIDLLY